MDTIQSKRHGRVNVNISNRTKSRRLPATAPDAELAGLSSKPKLNGSRHVAADASNPDTRPDKTLAALYAAGMLAVMLLAANTWLVQLPNSNRTALNWLVSVALLFAAGMWLLPWHRFDRKLSLVPVLIGSSFIALSVYFSGGWDSPFSIFYILVVIFCIIHLSPKLAALWAGLTLLVSLSPQIYNPDMRLLSQHLVFQASVYLLALVSWYAVVGRMRSGYEAELRKAQELKNYFQREASVDRLTNIYNRAHFEDQLREEFERTRRLGGDFVLVFLDLDNFKQLNDSYGHQMGDKALRLVAQILQSNARQIDVVARYGGDEFAVLMPGTYFTGARNFSERIRREVAERSRLNLDFAIHLSAGVVRFSRDISNYQQLLEAADDAMYLAKRQGKGRLLTLASLDPNKDGGETGLGD